MQQLCSLIAVVGCGLSSFATAYKVSARSNEPALNVSETLNITEMVPLHEELAAAILLVLINLTNCTGLISDKGAPDNPNITYHFGTLESDLAMLSDKVSGFYSVLYEMLGKMGHSFAHVTSKATSRTGESGCGLGSVSLLIRVN